MPRTLSPYPRTPITEGYRLPRRWRWTRSLRFRLTAFYTGVLALVLLLGFFLLRAASPLLVSGRAGFMLAGALVTVLAVSAAGGWVLIGRTLQPIQRIVNEVENLNADNVFDTTLPTAETDNEIGRLVHTLNHMLGRLNRAFQAKQRFAEAQQRFAADASHELRTPLTILRGEMEVALTRPRTVESYQGTIRSAVEEIDRMTHIVEALSFLARQDALQMAAEPVQAPVDLGYLVQTVTSEFARPAAEKSIQLCHVPGPEPAWVLGDEGQLHQLVRNLVENAVKYTPSGGKATVTLSGQRDPDSWLVQVEDTGIGIAENHLPHVFERFWRADRARTTPGSGLGLAISARIAQSHQGTLQVHSILGKGSCFEVLLPAAPAPARTAPT